MAEAKPILKRNDIDDKYKWKLEHLFETDEKWDEVFCFIPFAYIFKKIHCHR